MPSEYTIEEQDSLSDDQLKELDWKNLHQLNARLLELHANGELGNENSAKLPRPPILCIDGIQKIDNDSIEASFRFPDNKDAWPYDPDESLEMLFQDQLDQLVGFWGCRKVSGIGRALSSGACALHQSIDFEPGKTLRFRLKKRKWIEKADKSSGTAVFNGEILNENQQALLVAKNIIVGIVSPADIRELREKFGGMGGIDSGANGQIEQNLRIPVFDSSTLNIVASDDGIEKVTATQPINSKLWPLQFHFKGDPVVPGNFGTHGMIALLKVIARDSLKLNNPVFSSMASKKFSGQIFEDDKQVRFELIDVSGNEDGTVVAEQANLYLQSSDGEAMIENPIYTVTKLTLATN